MVLAAELGADIIHQTKLFVLANHVSFGDLLRQASQHTFESN